MAMDQRDWYRDLIRKRTGYVERSTFRSEVVKSKSAKSLFLLLLFVVIFAIFGFIFVVFQVISQLLR